MRSLVKSKQPTRTPGLTGFVCATVFIAISCLGTSNSHSDSRSITKLSDLDWIRKEDLTKEQAENCPTGCRGAYVAPVRTDEDANRPPSESPIRGEANASEINTQSETAMMEGEVVFTQGWRQLQSERVEIDRSKGTLKLEKNVSIREPGILLVGDSAYIDSQTDQIDIKAAEYLFHEQRIRGSASSITRSPTTGIAIDNATYTACEPGDEAWVLYADQIKINEKTGRASAKGVRIEAGDIPVFYAPYFQFIVDNRRASGLLYPSIGYANDDGFEYSQPVYLNLSPNQDLTLTPRIAAKRSAGLEAEHRLLTEQSFTRSAGAFYPDDDVNPEHRNSRWAAAVTHRSKNQKPWGSWSTQVDFAGLSDDDFLEDWDTEVLQAGPRDVNLRQHIGVSVELKHWQLKASATDYQNLINDDANQYREQPRIAFNGAYKLANNFDLRLNNEWASFDHDQDNLLVANTTGSLTASSIGNPLASQLSNDGTWVTGERSRANWSLSWNNQSAWGFFVPEIGLNYLSYDLDDPVLGSNDDNPDLFAPQASLDAGLNFERKTQLFGDTVLQTLQPRLYYLYRDSESQLDMPVFDTAVATESLDQLFRDNEFVGGDRLEDANRVSLGLWSRFYSRNQNREILSLGVGQSYYLRDKRTQLGQPQSIDSTSITASTLAVLLADAQESLNEQQRNRSDITAEAIWSLSESISIRSSIFWNDSQSELERSRLEFSYKPVETDNFLKLAYMQEDNSLIVRDNNRNGLFESSELVNEDVEQVSVSGQWSLNDRWKLLFLWREDLENRRNLDRVAGVSYESCCWNASVSWRSELIRFDNDGLITEAPFKDSSIVFYFEFFGLGGLGTSGENLLDRAQQ